MKSTAQKSKNSPLIILTSVAAIATVLAFIVTYFNTTFFQKVPIQSFKDTNRNKPKIFVSALLNFTVSIPEEYSIFEDPTFVNLRKNEMKINISKNGTNFDKIEEYSKDFDQKRKGISIKNQQIGKIDNLEYLSRVEEFAFGPIEKQKVYFLYINNTIYSISTSSEALFSDLDQIAQSFRYTP